MKYKELVELKKKEIRINNIKEIRKDIHKDWVQLKIKNHIKRFEGVISKIELEQGILNNDIIASSFCKEPSK